jgi:hypothetical protein
MLNFNVPSKTLRQTTAVLLSVVTVALAGLTTSAYAGNYDAVLGAGVGAAAGAIIGQQVGGRQGAVIGGATGAVIGASVGNASNHSGHHENSRVEPARGYYPPQRPAQVMVVNDYRQPEPRHWGWRHHGDHRDFRRDEYRRGEGHGHGYGHDRIRD